MDIDSSELDPFHFQCQEGCALCCLCQPQLVGRENKMFSKDPALKKGITKRSITGHKSRNYSIRLKGEKGACFFLQDRRCSIYDQRPLYCRLFPVHIHVGDRMQVVANLSCRGINREGKGIPMTDLVQEALEDVRSLRLLKDLQYVGTRYTEFYKDYDQGLMDLSRDRLQTHTLKLLESFGLCNFIKRTMAYSSIQEGVPADVNVIEPFLEDLGSPDVIAAAVRGALDTFQNEDLVQLPVWNDKALNWIVCRIRRDNVERCQMGEDGGLKIVRKIPLKEVGLRPFEPDAEDLAVWYSRIVIKRDLTYGYGAYMKTITDDDEPFLQVYLGSLGTILLDFWWRTSLLAALCDEEVITEDTVKEGIISYDMDFLDLPSLGGFI